MIRFTIDDNIKDLINWANEIPNVLADEKIAESCARIFTERAKAKLASSGALQSDINRFVNAITFKKISGNKWRISAGKGTDNQLKEDMYYLEFGTGIVGAWNNHPEADNVGWEYDKNKHGYNGWYYEKSKELGNNKSFIAEDTYQILNKNGSIKGYRTRGVIAVRYFYDTMVEFGDILQQALKENGVQYGIRK